jgi:hypothetical protein
LPVEWTPKQLLNERLRKLWKKVTLKNRRQAVRNRAAVAEALSVLSTYSNRIDAPRHTLPGELIVSLTSYPGRFATLHLTLLSLLDQSVRPDRILLWIADTDIDQLPPAVRDLASDRLSIRVCEDIRNFKKILPTRAEFPDAFILICDDDSYYPPDWLKGIVAHFDPARPAIICTRAHQVTTAPDGSLEPYRAWPRNVSADWTAGHRRDLLPTGNGGVLYPPGSLPEMTLDRDLIKKLSATSDDVWLFFMGRQAGFSVSRVPGKKREYLEWPQSQAGALWAFHRLGTKDEHLRDAAAHFGLE